MKKELVEEILTKGKVIYDDENGIKAFKFKGFYFTVDSRKTLDVVEHENRKFAIICAKLQKDWCPI